MTTAAFLSLVLRLVGSRVINIKRRPAVILLPSLLLTAVLLAGCVSSKISIEIHPDGSSKLQVGLGLDSRPTGFAGIRGQPWFSDLEGGSSVTIEKVTADGMDWEYVTTELDNLEQLNERLNALDWGQASVTRRAGILFITYEFRFRGTEPIFSRVEEEVDSELPSGDPADYASITWGLILPGRIQEHNGHNVDPTTNQVVWYIDVSQPIDLYARSRTFNTWTPIIAGVILVGLLVLGVGYIGIRKAQILPEPSSVVTTDEEIEPAVTVPRRAKKKRRFSIAGLTQQRSIIVVILAIADVLVICGMGVVIFRTMIQALSSATPSPISQPASTVVESIPTWTQTPHPAPTNTPIPTATPLPPGAATGEWETRFSTSSFDDSQTVVVYLEAEREISGWLDTYTPVLVLRCKEREIDAYVDVGMQIEVEYGMTDSATTRIRFDKDRAETMVMNESTDGEALFFRNPAAIIDTMTRHNEMVFGFTPFNASPVETTFDLRGLGEAIKPLRDACGRRLLTPTPYVAPTGIPTPTPLPAGNPIVIDNWQIRVERVLTAESLTSSYRDSTEKAAGRFALVFMAVTNRALSPRTFVPIGNLAIRDTAERLYTVNPMANVYAQDQYGTDIGADINPDETVHAVAVFDIPEQSNYYVLGPGPLADPLGSSVLVNIP
jgi:type VI secretion system protein VasI